MILSGEDWDLAWDDPAFIKVLLRHQLYDAYQLLYKGIPITLGQRSVVYGRANKMDRTAIIPHRLSRRVFPPS